MEIIIGTLVIWFISQTIKYSIRILGGERVSFQSFFWAYMWASGYPSSHSAVLAGLTYFVGVKEGFSTTFAITAVVSSVLLYNLIDNKKQQDLLKKFHQRGGAYKHLIDMSGHKLGEVVMGVMLGGVLAYILSPILL
ncbi:MAG: hypothetical protein COU90_03655 [Candidatus Ryanbacteria bacterium CG10_big_fil_rev_8_21_14_0_10_43_42]|uniref:Acid phosphatase n=1 Tax=Candidatus Ryanbacteria bacterium CG10_big_fil_rev_8_21_14_0_10_43_42 TaxID=1974864 RepID=A0A2M8KW92_9BACT|nr:MAG: hypothetical protein COU90_03655 [Candidatus Ryanbacteria bacterium CG10_big_fil_rev_8_21_14_0_10_43_42]